MDTDVQAIRRFNRFYTRLVGALDARFLDTDATLPEARVLFEVATREPVTATAIQVTLGLDAGYLSRILARFETRGWIGRVAGSGDARSRPIHLAPAGRAVFAAVDLRQHDAVADLLGPLAPGEREALVEALTRARLLLDPDTVAGLTIRPHRTGEVALIASRQAVLYAASHGWGRGLEIEVSEVAARFLRRFDPAREQCWVARLDGVLAGAVFLTDEGDDLARLRLLHVEPFARRRGIGDALVGQCVAFARDTGYRAITLWTHTVLEPARRLYARHGFRCVASDMHATFGEPVQGETWRLELPGTPAADDK